VDASASGIDRRLLIAVMQIIMVTNNALEDKMGGHERYVRELSSTLARRGHAVTIIAKRRLPGAPAHELRPDGVVIERHPVPSKRNPLYAALYPAYVLRGVASRTRRRKGGTVIHAHMSVPALPLALRGQRYLLTFHAPVWRELLSERQGTYVLPSFIQSPAVAGVRQLERLVAHRAARTVVLSEFMRSELALLDAGAGAGATVIPGGIDGRRFSVDRVRQPPDDALAPVLFTARRLTPRTGVDELIRAMPVIAERLPGAQLKIAGTGPQEVELRELATSTGLDGAIEFLGRISDEALVDWYRRASLVVLPTRELEGFGLTTAEALACGAAVIGTPAGATPELLAPLDPSLLAEDVSAAAIAEAVVAVLGKPDRLERIRAAAAARIMPAMGWDAVADRYLEIYESFN
jgi:glycosyltransferase involved in cell wall biosynthesis